MTTVDVRLKMKFIICVDRISLKYSILLVDLTHSLYYIFVISINVFIFLGLSPKKVEGGIYCDISFTMPTIT